MTKSKSSGHGPSRNTGAGGRNSGGGGINMRNHVKPTVRGGPPSTQKISVEAAAAQGNKRGNHSMQGTSPTSKAARPPLVEKNVAQVPSGNAVALNVGRGGPGVGRVVHDRGTQGVHGPVNPGGPALTPNPGGGPGGFGFTDKGGK